MIGLNAVRFIREDPAHMWWMMRNWKMLNDKNEDDNRKEALSVLERASFLVEKNYLNGC